MIKVGFCGAGATGKSSVATKLAEKSGLIFIGSVSRGVMQRKGLTEQDQRQMPARDLWELQKELFEAKIAQDTASVETEALFDRTPLDHLAYCLFRCFPVLEDYEVKNLLAATRAGLEKYSLIVYFPLPTWVPPADGFREDKMANRVIIDTLIKGFLETWGFSYYQMTGYSSVEDRVEDLMREIELIKGS